MAKTKFVRSPAACTQPQCLLRDEEVGPEFLADLICKLMAGEDIDASKAIPQDKLITYYDRCRKCVIDVMQEKGPLETVGELRRIEEGRRSHRRERRERPERGRSRM
jgi:hypothetical protein